MSPTACKRRFSLGCVAHTAACCRLYWEGTGGPAAAKHFIGPLAAGSSSDWYEIGSLLDALNQCELPVAGVPLNATTCGDADNMSAPMRIGFSIEIGIRQPHEASTAPIRVIGRFTSQGCTLRVHDTPGNVFGCTITLTIDADEKILINGKLMKDFVEEIFLINLFCEGKSRFLLCKKFCFF